MNSELDTGVFVAQKIENMSDKSGRKLGYIYDLLYDIKTTEQLQQEVEYLANRLAGLASLCRGDRRPIDNYLKEVLDLKEERRD